MSSDEDRSKNKVRNKFTTERSRDERERREEKRYDRYSNRRERERRRRRNSESEEESRSVVRSKREKERSVKSSYKEKEEIVRKNIKESEDVPSGISGKKIEGISVTKENDEVVKCSVEKLEEVRSSVNEKEVVKCSVKEGEVKSVTTEMSESAEECFGPMLPPHLLQKPQPEEQSYGPALPKHLSERPVGKTYVETTVRRETIGPELPEHLRHLPVQGAKSDKPEPETAPDEESFGPCPSLMASGSGLHIPHAFREKKIEIEVSNSNKRDSWMTELPSETNLNFGLGPRQFRSKLGPEKGQDRSMWTDTPADTERKAKEPEKVDHSQMVKNAAIEARDKEMEKLAKKAEKKLKRYESLVEIHEKKMRKIAKKEAKKREKEGKPVERRPFNRDTDLQVNRFDEAQKRAVLKKAQLLNDRFSQGESKFL